MHFSLLLIACFLVVTNALYQDVVHSMVRDAVDIAKKVEQSSGIDPRAATSVVSLLLSGIVQSRAQVYDVYKRIAALTDIGRPSGITEDAEESAKQILSPDNHEEQLLSGASMHEFILGLRNMPTQCPPISVEVIGSILGHSLRTCKPKLTEGIRQELLTRIRADLTPALEHVHLKLVYVHLELVRVCNHGTPDRSRAIEAYKQALLTLVSAILQCRKGALGYIYNNYAA